MTRYLATINVPGYLPTDDDPPVFDTAAEAWQYLIAERNDAWNDTEDMGPDFDYAMDQMGRLARFAGDLITNDEACETVIGRTPGYGGDHDLGLAYTVTAVD